MINISADETGQLTKEITKPIYNFLPMFDHLMKESDQQICSNILWVYSNILGEGDA